VAGINKEDGAEQRTMGADLFGWLVGWFGLPAGSIDWPTLILEL
jgi:hypothetical protein